MPNHVHGIIIINKQPPHVETQDFASPHNTGLNLDFASLWNAGYEQNPEIKNHFGPQSKNLASIIRGFKIGVTKYAEQNDTYFAWQSRFHDDIIRNEEEYQRIQNYILANPKNWKEDRFFIAK